MPTFHCELCVSGYEVALLAGDRDQSMNKRVIENGNERVLTREGHPENPHGGHLVQQTWNDQCRARLKMRKSP